MNVQENIRNCQQDAVCKIIDMADFGECREKELEAWLVDQIARVYGDRSDIIVKNPLLRITTIFDALGEEAQHELYGYVKCAAVGKNGKMDFRKEFWNFLEMAHSAWDDIEKFADGLMYREKAYKQKIMC